MFKKLLYVFFAGMTLVALMGTDATAKCSFRSGKLICTELTLISEWSVNFNKDNFVCTAFIIRGAEAMWLVNGGTQSRQAVSSNFDAITYTAVQDITSYNMTDQKGIAEVTEKWDWDYLKHSIAQGFDAQNFNWSVDGGECITDMLTGFFIWQDFKGEWVLNDQAC